MLRDFLEEAFAYHRRCDRELIEAFQKVEGEEIPGERRLLAHIVNAHRIWNARIDERTPDVGVWDLHSLEAIERMDVTGYENSLRILSEQDLTAPLHYRNSKGFAFKNSVQDLLFHIINHGSYHRGQITIRMREKGLEPLVSDYAILKREEA